MIVRAAGDEYHLFRQHDHAQLAGAIAARVGNADFDRPAAVVLDAIAQHDAGWPLHDDRPTIDPRGSPRDVFASTLEIAAAVWTGSAAIATQHDPYAGLLVSLHVLRLSADAATPAPGQASRPPHDEPRLRFELNKFQHAQIELQEELRAELGLAIDKPLHYGLAEASDDPREQRLAADFRLLQAMDLLSLTICCTTPPAEQTGPLHPRADGPSVRLSIRRPTSSILTVSPWPFDAGSFDVSIPFRRLPRRAYESEADLQYTLGRVRDEPLVVSIRHR